ncbi:hypothetical protein BGZ63DRAFT_398263 [Mariannaea sp. PMI_226]|nr:hypothetical protein BGZ63DRAFT_398263 [Mariannaea sp. PMI_226]
MTLEDIENKPAAGVPYFTPAQVPAAGTADDVASAPTLFKPIRTRGIELQNRFVVSPMCTYSAKDGYLTDWHLVHLGQFALHGASLVTVEATAVEPRGRISPNDSGLWEDGQIVPLKRIADFIHSQNSKVMIQLAHAGRKASTLAPWLGGTVNKTVAPETVGGWPNDVVAPSPIPYADDHANPKELTVDEIKGLVQSFVDAAVRAVKAGVDAIEIHGAHGYLLNQFLSPVSNQRTDEYGGSFENRTRFLVEVIEAVRAVIPEEMPLWVRISATEWLEHTGNASWDINESIKLAKLLPGLGVDVLDVSTAGNNENQKLKPSQTYQTDLAREIRKAVHAEGLNLLVAAVGLINESEFAKTVVQEDQDPSADLVLVARQFLREPNWVLTVAHDLNVPVRWASQYQRAPPKPNGRHQPKM